VRCLLIVFGPAVPAIMSSRVEGSESQTSMISQCPNKPNWVSSGAPQGPRRMDPLRYQGSAQDAREKLLVVIRSFPRSTVVRIEDMYMKAEFRSAIFSFVDDVEFEFDDGAKVIHFRSASRLGYYDFGVNRRRMETIGRQFSGKQSSGSR
jgi:uncharacterized protein (DUF1499 family)